MTKLPKLNVKLLRKVARHLKADPRRYDQGEWGITTDPEEDGPACHTQGCIAGWTVFLSVPKAKWGYWKGRPGSFGNYLDGVDMQGIAKKATTLLGLTNDEAVKLFRADNQEYTMGEEGVEEATRKINDLIADRASFVTKW